MHQQKYLTETQMAQLLNVSRWALISWRKAGLPYLRASRTVRYDPQRVIAWLEKNAKREARDPR